MLTNIITILIHSVLNPSSVNVFSSADQLHVSKALSRSILIAAFAPLASGLAKINHHFSD